MNRVLIPAAAVLVAAGLYAVTAGYGFVYDDVHIIQNNTLLHSLANWPQILTSSWWPGEVYRPFTELSFATDWALSGGDPRWFHVVNTLLHAAVTGIVYAVARSGLGSFGAAAAAFTFAVHPVHVEAVANVVGRAELLATAWVLVAVLAYRADGRLARGGERLWRRAATSLGTLLATGLAMASKETAFATPGLLLLIDWLEASREGESFAARFRRHAVLWFASVAFSLEWLWIRTLALGDLAGTHPAPGLQGLGLVDRALVMTPVVPQYARLLFVPARLSADYSPDYLPAVPAVRPATVGGLLLLSAAIALAVGARRRWPVVTFALAWMAGTLLIVSNLIVPSGVLLAERTLYLPSVGAVLLFGWLTAWCEASWRHAGVALTALAVGLGGLRTATRLPVWRDNGRFFPQLVQDAAGSYRAYWVAGVLAYASGEAVRGEVLLRRALLTFPYHAAVWGDLAQALERQGRWLEAAQHFKAAFLIEDTVATNALLSARNYLRAGFPDSARAIALRAGAVNPYHPAFEAAMAEIATAGARYREALAWRRRTAFRFPKTWRYWALLGEAALEAGQCRPARQALERLHGLRAPAAPVERLEARLAAMHCSA